MGKRDSNTSAAPSSLDLAKVKQAIETTGFTLEYQVSEQFRKAGWSVINNKYYVDDIANSVREIDLIAYKVKKFGEIPVYTSLIVSCKKNEKRLWALLSKQLRSDDPNVDWHPQHAWSNHPSLAFMLAKPDWVSRYIELCKLQSIYETLISPKRHVFAFQEIDKDKYTCQNDTNIFNAISSLMKAQGYEIGALNVRKRGPAVYIFGLIAIVDTELVRVDFGASGAMKAEAIDDDRYIGSYIINQKEITARIHFVTAQAFPRLLTQYDKLHQCNLEVVAALEEQFYDDILADDDRSSIIDPMFSRAVRQRLNLLLWQSTREAEYKSREYKARRMRTGTVEVYGVEEDAERTFLNASSEAKQLVTDALLKYYRYRGTWSFESELPF